MALINTLLLNNLAKSEAEYFSSVKKVSRERVGDQCYFQIKKKKYQVNIKRISFELAERIIYGVFAPVVLYLRTTL